MTAEGANAPTPQQILDLPLDHNDAEAATVREYLVTLLAAIWDDGDDLNPFGNSGWKWDLYRALVKAGYANNPFDEDGYVTPDNDFDEPAARRLIAEAIGALPGVAASAADQLRERLQRISRQAGEISRMAQVAAENSALREQVARLQSDKDSDPSSDVIDTVAARLLRIKLYGQHVDARYDVAAHKQWDNQLNDDDRAWWRDEARALLAIGRGEPA